MVDTSSILGTTNVNVDGIISGAGNIIQAIAFFLLAGAIVGVITYFIMSKKPYKYKIHIFEEINGVTTPVGDDLAKEMSLPNTSVRVFYLKNRKLFLPRPTRQTGKGHFFYFVRDDHEWINIGLGNLNKELKDLGVKYDHTDMRYANASLKSLVEKNYKKTSWLKEYAPYIAIGILVLLLGVVFFLILNKTEKVLGPLANVVQQQAEILKAITELLHNVDNLGSTSGITRIQ